MPRKEPLERLLAEQIAYYRAVAFEYGATAIPDVPDAELAQARAALIEAIDRFRPTGSVLELACGPGTWTRELLRHADRVTAVDAAPEMLVVARSRVADERVTFVEADLFAWRPAQRYDAAFFGFWLSHVPDARFAEFWALIDACLKPDGRVAFADDGHRTTEELIEGEQSEVILRRLTDGASFRAVKVALAPDRLESRLADLGWDVTVRSVGGPFLWGDGSRAS